MARALPETLIAIVATNATANPPVTEQTTFIFATD
jgi:hypothetical protein